MRITGAKPHTRRMLRILSPVKAWIQKTLSQDADSPANTFHKTAVPALYVAPPCKNHGADAKHPRVQGEALARYCRAWPAIMRSMFLQRPKLLEKLRQSAAARGLTLVVAPMGYGKSALARALAGAVDKAYYYAVPGGPHDGHFIWHDLGRSLEADRLDIARGLGQLGLPETASQYRQAEKLLAGLPGQTTLIVDDYHNITDPRLDAFWENVIPRLPDLHIVLFSRTRPSLKQEEMRIKGLAEFFDQNFLKFSPEEADELFRLGGVHDPVAAAAAHRYSEGWPAVLWLCLSNWLYHGRLAESVNVDSLLTSHLAAAYSPEEQDFLLRLSVFESFADTDAAQITAAFGASVNLRALCEKNPFLTVDGKTGHYQFHSLFRDFLRRELAAKAHIDKPALRRLAGECLFARRDHVGAFRLFQEAGRDEDLSRLLDTFARFDEDRNLIHFAEEHFGAASKTPWRVRFANPLGWLAAVELYSHILHDHRTAALLDEAEARFRQTTKIPAWLKKRLRGEIEVIRAFLAFNDADKMLGHYRAAVRILDGPSAFVTQDASWAYGSPSLVFPALREAGEYEGLLKKGAEAMRLYDALSSGKTRDPENLFLAEYHLERANFAEAAALFTPFLARKSRANKNSDLPIALIAAFGLARCHIAGGRPQAALDTLETLRWRVEDSGVLWNFECLDMAVGYVGAVLGRPDVIPKWLRDGEMFDPPHNSLPQVFGIGLYIHGRALLLRGDFGRLAVAASELPRAAPFKSLFGELHGLILKSLAAQRERGRAAALGLLEQALELARPDGLTLALAEYGEHILPLLRLMNRSGPEDAHLAAVLTLAAHIAHVAAPPGRNGKSLLTPRELELMRHVGEGKSNPAIAQDLGISSDTVKITLHRVYIKLGARGRVEAARRFAELYPGLRPEAPVKPQIY